jgi:hypothetical protein
MLGVEVVLESELGIAHSGKISPLNNPRITESQIRSVYPKFQLVSYAVVECKDEGVLTFAG